jgi:hypothetical protein
MKNVSQRKAPGAMSAMAFIVNPVNPKVGVIFTSPVFSVMYSPFNLSFILSLQMDRTQLNPCPRTAMLERLSASEMQRFDARNHRFI